MIGALLRRQLRQLRWLSLSLFAGLVGLEWFLVVVLSRIDTGAGLRFLQRLLPPELQTLFATELGMASFGGMVAFGFRHPATLVAAIAFVVALATGPAAEREGGFLELLLSRPLTRRRYLAATTLLLVGGAALLPLGLLGGAAIGLGQVDHAEALPWTRYARPALGLSTLLLAIGGYTLYFAVRARRRGPATALSVGLTVGLFWLEILGRLWSPLELFGWLSPFRYYDPLRSAVTGHLPPRDVLVLLGIFLVALTAAFHRFEREDL